MAQFRRLEDGTLQVQDNAGDDWRQVDETIAPPGAADLKPGLGVLQVPSPPLPLPPVDIPAQFVRDRAARRGKFQPVDADHDGKTDTIGVDRNADGVIDERDAPPADIYTTTYRGNKVRIAVLDVIVPPPPPPPTVEQVMAGEMEAATAQIAKLWRWIKGLVVGGGASLLYYLFATFVMGWTFFGGGYAMSESERLIRDAQDTPGSWYDGLLPEEVAPIEAALAKDAEGRGE